ncbi:MAG: hypothetical protein RH948_14350 [Cyclobacteriaceae bacterium]
MQSQLIVFFLTLLSFPFSREIPPAVENHALYLSLVEVDHKDLGATAVIKIKVFADDMEDAIMNVSERRIDFLKTSNCDNGRSEVEAYFTKHFEYSINGKRAALTFTHCEPNGDAIWFHFKINCPNRWTKVEVKADFLMELFPTQSNIVTIYHGEEKRFLKITNAHPEEAVTF